MQCEIFNPIPLPFTTRVNLLTLLVPQGHASTLPYQDIAMGRLMARVDYFSDELSKVVRRDDSNQAVEF